MNLARVDLREALLTRTLLGRANLREADLRQANLQQAILGEADLQDADLQHANLSGAYLAAANLQRANLYATNLREAVLLQTARQFRRRLSPEGVAGFGDFGAVRISRVDPDIEAMITPNRSWGIA